MDYQDVNDMKIIKFRQTHDGFFMDSSAYPNYLNKVKDKILEEALQFMSASWHYDHNDPRCPHDSKIDSLIIRENLIGDFSVTNIEMLLLGGYDNRFSLSYSNVHNYSIKKNKCEWPKEDYSHGDWLIDEIILLNDNLLMHEIIFTDAVIKIKATDIIYKIL